MLLNKGPDTQTLLGATVIDLADYVATASTPGVTAHPPESHYGAEGFIRTTYRLLNLVGTKVGSIDMSLRLRNLGMHMLAHWKNTNHVRRPPSPPPVPPQQLAQPPPRKANIRLKERKGKPRRKKKEKIANATRLARRDPAKDMTDALDQREAERERALTAAVDAIARKKNARPGVDGEMTSHCGQSPLSPPPLYYYNDGVVDEKSRRALSPLVGPKRRQERGGNNSSASPGSALGPTARNQNVGSTEMPDQPPRVTSQRRGTYFGTYSRKEVNERKADDGSESGQAAAAAEAAAATQFDANAFENQSRQHQVRLC